MCTTRICRASGVIERIQTREDSKNWSLKHSVSMEMSIYPSIPTLSCRYCQSPITLLHTIMCQQTLPTRVFFPKQIPCSFMLQSYISLDTHCFFQHQYQGADLLLRPPHQNASKLQQDYCKCLTSSWTVRSVWATKSLNEGTDIGICIVTKQLMVYERSSTKMKLKCHIHILTPR